MVGYKNILFCTDYSEDADIAFIYAVDLAERYGAKLHVIHVLHSGHRYSHWETDEGVPIGQEEWANPSPELMARVTQLIKERHQDRLTGVKEVTWQVLPGVPFVEIVRYARENDIDLIVMGAMGRSELEPTVYGSTVENVSRRAHCHVMAIRNPEKTYTL
ncbi:MAG: universal stress protein [Proteobacteria bacterium]|nr:universal stress protein [Pseudomonadota bacterium]MBU1743031.1 universal stress protein [Pseudomonadota bacterium]